MRLMLFVPVIAVGAVLSQTAAATSPEWVRFPSADAELNDGKPTSLNAAVYRPGGDWVGKGPFPAVVALHGCGGLGTKAEPVSPRHADWGQRLADLGYIVVMPDSFSSRGLGSQCTTKARTVRPGRERTRDAAGARLWLQALPDVDKSRVSLLGWSNGGSTVLYAASRTAPKFPGPDFHKAVAFYPGCRLPAAADNVPRVPMLLLIGLADNWTPAAPCREFDAKARAAGGSVTLVTYDGAYHDFDHPNLPVRERTGLAFTGDDSGRAFLGTNPAARADALIRVPKFLAD